MSSQYKGNLLTGVIASHFAGLMILLNQSARYSSSIYYGMGVSTLYLVFFFFDIPVFLMFLALAYRPYIEGGARTVGLFWVLQMNIALLPTGDIGPAFLITSILEIVFLIWPKRYIPFTEEEIQIEDEEGETTRIRCSHCGATYAYNPDTIESGGVACQNCGKSTKV